MRYNYLLEVFEALAAESSRNAKIEILESLKDDELLKTVLRLCYDNYIQFFIKKIPDYRLNNSFNGVHLHRSLLDCEKVLAGRLKTGNAAKLFLENQLEEMVTEDAKVLEMVISRNMECGISTSTINKVWPGLIPTFDVMLCSEFERGRVEYPCIAQEKLDGMRALFIKDEQGNYTLRSRKGLVIEDLGFFENLAKALPAGFVLDGELLVSDNKGGFLPRKKGNGVCNKAIKGTISPEEASQLVFSAFDVIPLATFKGEYEGAGTLERFKSLESFIQKNPINNLVLVESKILNSERDILSMFTEFTEKGMEGVVVKNPNQLWEPKRSKGWMKMKMELEMELQVEEVIEGLGKHRGRLGTLKCRDASGVLKVGIGGGYSDEQREEFWASKNDLVGAIITVRYNEIITDSSGDASLFLPRFIELRLDKDEPDDVYKIL